MFSLIGRGGGQESDDATVEILLTARGRRAVLRAADECGVDHVLRAHVSGKKYSRSESGDLIQSIGRHCEASYYLLGHAGSPPCFSSRRWLPPCPSALGDH